MQEFDIILRFFQQVQDFVALSLNQPFDITVGNERQQINGKDFLGMFSLDYTRALKVCARCGDDAFSAFRQAALQVAAN